MSTDAFSKKNSMVTNLEHSISHNSIYNTKKSPGHGLTSIKSEQVLGLSALKQGPLISPRVNFIKKNVDEIKHSTQFEINRNLFTRKKQGMPNDVLSNIAVEPQSTQEKERPKLVDKKKGGPIYLTRLHDKSIEELDRLDSKYRKYNFYGRKQRILQEKGMMKDDGSDSSGREFPLETHRQRAERRHLQKMVEA